MSRDILLSDFKKEVNSILKPLIEGLNKQLKKNNTEVEPSTDNVVDDESYECSEEERKPQEKQTSKCDALLKFKAYTRLRDSFKHNTFCNVTDGKFLVYIKVPAVEKSFAKVVYIGDELSLRDFVLFAYHKPFVRVGRDVIENYLFYYGNNDEGLPFDDWLKMKSDILLDVYNTFCERGIFKRVNDVPIQDED